MRRISTTVIKLGASAYDWRTRRPTQWHPGPVEDAEELCRKLLDRALNAWSMFLREAEYTDTLMELIALVWRLERQYDPEKASSFTAYATWIVSQRAVDYGPRRILGRHGTRTWDYMSPHEDPYEGSSMGESLDGFSVDDPGNNLADLSRVLEERSGEINGKTIELGFGQDRIPEGRDDRT